MNFHSPIEKLGHEKLVCHDYMTWKRALGFQSQLLTRVTLVFMEINILPLKHPSILMHQLSTGADNFALLWHNIKNRLTRKSVLMKDSFLKN